MSLFDPTVGPDRVSLVDMPAEELATAERKGLIIIDGRRARSHYFDGRFLAARDLTREQNYFLTREADLAQAGGAGVIRGLDVTQSAASTVDIAAGQGTTAAGELVTLSDDTTISLADVPGIDRIDAAAGLTTVPQTTPPAQRTGIFVLGLRPVEFSTRSITKYPTAVNGKRSLENGDIAEAVAITLVPYVVDGLDDNPWHQRSHIASIAFMDQGLRGIPAEVLPLAMLKLEGGTIRWIDQYLVRRDVAANHEGVVGFGVTPRALREAHLLQYDQQLAGIVAQRKNVGALRFAATDYFEVLPPVGRIPAATINPSDFTQVFFPPTMTVSLSIVPTDELAALLEEGLLQAPIQVAGPPEDLDFTSIQVLIPSSRQALLSLRPHSIRRPFLAPAIPALRRPVDILNHLTFSAPPQSAIIPPGDPIAAQWRQMLTALGDGMLWYTRSRALSLTIQVSLPLDPPPPTPPGGT